ncbi:MAG: tonB-system energizer ExbB [Hyphomicrobiaceae bacterium]|nr:tonB-system energizer ExbB [Hyphomicrobiaceae bacterium]
MRKMANGPALLAGLLMATAPALTIPVTVWAQAPAPAETAQPAPAATPPETAPVAAPAATSAAQDAAATPSAATEPGTPMPVEDLPIAGSGVPGAPPAPVAESSAGPNPNLPHDLSPWAMFMQADMVVKSVMIGLAIASVITWTVWLVKSVELFVARARLRRALRAVSNDASLAAASNTLGNSGSLLRSYIDVAAIELRMSTDTPDKNGIKERVASRLERIESAAVRSMNKGTGVLATIGATAPFVGLFGTVWGIMNSFIGISKSQTTNLAVVAPGIAEALLATAIGLVAAIPAVIIYNWFSRGIGVYRALAGDASAEVMRLVSRDLDRVNVHRHARAAE